MRERQAVKDHLQAPDLHFSGAEGTRTPDPLHAMQVRYQLRHSPESVGQSTRPLPATKITADTAG